jgi:2-polyprenyl-3-methyl-5-hydroxy-6-metoxy-1,4-benzoquinol methylase
MSGVGDRALESRARQSLGQSGDAIYAAAVDGLRRRAARGAVVDVGCGTGRLKALLSGLADSYVGVDAVRYDGFPGDAPFCAGDLNREAIPIADESADIAVSLETIEHLENPRAFCRELVRVTKPGGWLLVTTPNQRSLVSLGALLLKEHFSAFRDSSYPAHQTALLDTDLRRIAAENGLQDLAIEFTCAGRIPLAGAFYPRAVSRAFPRSLSDNVLLFARKPLRNHAD